MKRVFYTWDKWECYPAGFYEDKPPGGMTPADAVQAYADFLRDHTRFREAAFRLIAEWPNSCEHYLTNENMNRIAWIGQASMCLATGVPACFRSGFHALSKDEQDAADAIALEALNAWLSARGEQALAMEEAAPKTKANLY